MFIILDIYANNMLLFTCNQTCSDSENTPDIAKYAATKIAKC